MRSAGDSRERAFVLDVRVEDLLCAEEDLGRSEDDAAVWRPRMLEVEVLPEQRVSHVKVRRILRCWAKRC